VLARWSGWGAIPKVFDEADEQFATARAELKTLLEVSEWRAAAKTTLNAHYTDAAIAAVMWDAVRAGASAPTLTARPVRCSNPDAGRGPSSAWRPTTPRSIYN